MHPKVGLVTKEEFETQRGGEEGGKEGDGDLVFPLDLQEGSGAAVKGEGSSKSARPSPAATTKE